MVLNALGIQAELPSTDTIFGWGIGRPPRIGDLDSFSISSGLYEHNISTAPVDTGTRPSTVDIALPSINLVLVVKLTTSYFVQIFIPSNISLIYTRYSLLGISWSEWKPFWTTELLNSADYNGLAISGVYTTSAASVSLKISPSSLTDGLKFRFKSSVANTGAYSIGVKLSSGSTTFKDAVTVSGAVLPANYIRTDVPTEVRYDATLDKFVVDREIEADSNSNGYYRKYADGTLECQLNLLTGLATDVAAGSGFRSNNIVWTYPHAFIEPPATPASSLTGIGLWTGGTANSTLVTFRIFAFTSVVTVLNLRPSAKGRWY